MSMRSPTKDFYCEIQAAIEKDAARQKQMIHRGQSELQEKAAALKKKQAAGSITATDD